MAIRADLVQRIKQLFEIIESQGHVQQLQSPQITTSLPDGASSSPMSREVVDVTTPVHVAPVMAMQEAVTATTSGTAALVSKTHASFFDPRPAPYGGSKRTAATAASSNCHPAKKQQRSSDVNSKLKYSSKAEMQGKNISVSDILLFLQENGKIHKNTDLELTNIPSLSDTGKYRKAMSFVQTIWTEKERVILSNREADRNQVTKVVVEIANRVKQEIARLKGKGKPDSRQKTYYMGLANQLGQLSWEKPVAQARVASQDETQTSISKSGDPNKRIEEEV